MFLSFSPPLAKNKQKYNHKCVQGQAALHGVVETEARLEAPTVGRQTLLLGEAGTFLGKTGVCWRPAPKAGSSAAALRLQGKGSLHDEDPVCTAPDHCGRLRCLLLQQRFPTGGDFWPPTHG